MNRIINSPETGARTYMRMGLGDPVGFENLEEGRVSQRKLAILSFDAARFGHGKPIARDASTRFRNKHGKDPEEVHQQRSAA